MVRMQPQSFPKILGAQKDRTQSHIYTHTHTHTHTHTLAGIHDIDAAEHHAPTTHMKTNKYTHMLYQNLHS